MFSFTIKLQPHPTLVTLEERVSGQVDIIAHAADKNSYRLATILNGKLRLCWLHRLSAATIGIDLDLDGYPVIERMPF